MTSRIEPIGTAEISRMWDELAEIRFHQITDGSDITFNEILAPIILRWAREKMAKTVLDAGCGVGVLSQHLSTMAESVIGIDPSATSVTIASREFGEAVQFEVNSIEAFSATYSKKFDLIVANMVLMDCADISTFLVAAHSLLNQKGEFLWSIPHPWFWPEYYGYADAKWFDYSKEIFVRRRFKISRSTKKLPYSVHVHRPISMVLNSLSSAGFVTSEIIEPMPSEITQAKYPSKWTAPRYILGKSKKLD